MPQGLTSLQIAQAVSLLDIPFDTFKRKIFVYMHPDQSITGSNPSFNFAYPEDENPDATVVNTPVTGECFAVIEYLTSVEAQKIEMVTASVRYKAGKNVARVSVRPDGRAFLERSERIEFDGLNFVVITDGMPRGLIEPNYYDYYLQARD